MEPYALYLSELHARLSTPEALVDAAVRRVTGRLIVSRRRIVGGEANEVYEIGFSDRWPLIVRISRDKEKNFEQERWAIEQCRRLDVPVPEVRWIEHLSSETGPLDICIQEKLEGRVLSPDVIAATPRDMLRTLAVSLGGYLSRIHDICVDGVGYLDGAGKGAPPPTEPGWSRADENALLGVADRSGFPREAMQRILDLAAAHARSVADPRLVHNDMRAHHIMVDGARITGIIDWGEVAGEAPIQDLVHWDYWDGDCLPLAWLREGYGEASLFEEDCALRLRLGRLDYGLCVLQWYHDRGFNAGVAAAQHKLLDDLAAAAALERR